MSTTFNDTNTGSAQGGMTKKLTSTERDAAFINKAPLGAQPGLVNEQKLVLSDEELVVGKRQVNAGNIQVEKRVDTQAVSVPVTLKHEEALIERRPIKAQGQQQQQQQQQGGFTTGTADSSKFSHHAFQPETINMSTTAEQAVATKAVIPKEEIHLSKSKVSETQQIHDTVRKEHADVHNNLQALPNIQIKQGQQTRGASLPQFDSNGGRVVAFEEKLGVGKQVVPTGEVSVTKRVETQPVQASVGLTHDELKVDRRPIGNAGGAFDTSSAFQGGASTTIPLTAEKAVIDKRVVPKEEVILKKKEEVAQKAVQTQLRSEHVDVHPSTTTTSNQSTTGQFGTGQFGTTQQQQQKGGSFKCGTCTDGSCVTCGSKNANAGLSSSSMSSMSSSSMPMNTGAAATALPVPVTANTSMPTTTNTSMPTTTTMPMMPTTATMPIAMPVAATAVPITSHTSNLTTGGIPDSALIFTKF